MFGHVYPTRRGSWTRGLSLLWVAALLTAVSGCSTGTPAGPGAFNDPYENANRKVHAFNKGVDKVVLRPASKAWGAVVPPPLRQGILNIAELLDTPGRVVNDFLQGDLEDGVHNSWRFVINGTFGILGLFDVASVIGLDERETNFGETLHVWGAGEGAYLEAPLLGPTTQRDLAGTVVDFLTNPLGLILPMPDARIPPALQAAQIVDFRYSYGDTLDDVFDNSADSYAQLRQIYLQQRRFELGARPGAAAPEAAPDVVDPYEELFGE